MNEDNNNLNRGKVEIDLNEYQELETSTSGNASKVVNNDIERNVLENKINNLETKGIAPEEELTQEEHDQNINSATKLNEAGKKEIRMEVDETVSRVHEKDRKRSKLIGFIIFVLPLIIISFFIYRAILNNKHDVLIDNVKKSAQKYMEDDEQASYMYSLMVGKIDSITIKAGELKRRGYIDFDLIDPLTKEDYTDYKIVVNVQKGKLTYTFPVK